MIELHQSQHALTILIISETIPSQFKVLVEVRGSAALGAGLEHSLTARGDRGGDEVELDKWLQSCSVCG